jgi:hypothetical protein
MADGKGDRRLGQKEQLHKKAKIVTSCLWGGLNIRMLSQPCVEEKEKGWIYVGVFRGGISITWLRQGDMVSVRRS